MVKYDTGAKNLPQETVFLKTEYERCLTNRWFGETGEAVTGIVRE
jgi:hypothetical protein